RPFLPDSLSSHTACTRRAFHSGSRRAASFPLAHIDKMSGDGCGRSHRRRHEMRAPAIALPAFEVAVRRRGAAFARCQLVWIHGKTHRAAGLAPVEARGLEDLVEAFGFRLF